MNKMTSKEAVRLLRPQLSLRQVTSQIGSIRFTSGEASASSSSSSSTSSTRKERNTKRPVTVARDLPDPFKNKNRNKKYFFGYGIGVLISCIIIFNYEKTTSPILNSVFYFLRRSDVVKQTLGEEIRYKSAWPWISGELNTVKGRIDISFSVTGDKSEGIVRFKASRESKLESFKIHHWELVTHDGKVIDLKHSDSMDFGF